MLKEIDEETKQIAERGIEKITRAMVEDALTAVEQVVLSARGMANGDDKEGADRLRDGMQAVNRMFDRRRQLVNYCEQSRNADVLEQIKKKREELGLQPHIPYIPTQGDKG